MLGVDDGVTAGALGVSYQRPVLFYGVAARARKVAICTTYTMWRSLAGSKILQEATTFV